MTILTVGSTNPEFSFVIQKNPETIKTSKAPFERSLRKGKVYGWYSKTDDSEFRLMFRDSELEASFSPKGEFEYLDKTRYSSPYLPIQMIVEALNSASKGDPRDTSDFKAYCHTVIKIPDRLVRSLKSKSAEDETIVLFSPLKEGYYGVMVTSSTVAAVLGMMNIVCILATLVDEDFYVPLGKDVLVKYLKMLNKAKAGYYARHLFISRAFSNIKTFQDCVGDGLINTPTMTFEYGNTQQQRLAAIKTGLGISRDVVRDTLFDLGCGEMSHTLKLVMSYSTLYAVEADEEISRINGLKVAKRGLDQIIPMHQTITPEWIAETAGLIEGSDVLMSEFLEHVDIKDAETILNAVLLASPKRVVITVPNRNFNKFYGLKDDEFRHPDHKWEPTEASFKAFALMKNPNGYATYFHQVGDIVDGHSTSLMAVIQKKD